MLLNNIMKLLRFITVTLLIIIASGSAVYGRKITLSGHIFDKVTGESLIGAGVIIDEKTGTVTNNFGFYSINIESGEHSLVVSYIGYKYQEQKINFGKDTTLNFYLVPDNTLQESVITAHKEAGIHSTYMGSVEIPLDIVRTAPSLFGEADVMKTIQLMPGVQGGTEGTSGIFVRGGGPDENLIMLDGVPIYNVDHMMGIFSVFTPDAVKKVTLYKGSFPARYSGRISSIIDVRTNDGNMKEYHGAVSTGLLNSKLYIEGPIFKEKTSFFLSGRGLHTLLLDPIIMKLANGNYFFYDINGKLTHRINDNNTLILSVYNGKDLMRVNPSDDSSSGFDRTNISWGNTILSAKWNHVFNGKLFATTSLSFNKYKMLIDVGSYSTSDRVKDYMQANFNSGIRDYIARIDFDYKPLNAHYIRFGAEYINHTFIPETISLREKTILDGETKVDTTFAAGKNRKSFGNEMSVYIEDDIEIGKNITVNPGIHLSLFHTDGKTYFSPEPRISGRYDFGKGITTKISYSRMAQYIHLLSYNQITLPTDLWVPITKKIRPVTSDQYSLGFYYSGLKGWEFSVEGYIKNMNNVLEYKEGEMFIGSSLSWDEKVEMGKGFSRGLEFFVQKTSGKTTGWIGYTLAKSERQFESINYGRKFPYKYDRRHSISIALNHKFNEKFDIGATWVFATGNAITAPTRVSTVVAPNTNEASTYSHISSRNNYRIPPTHRLNLGFNFTQKHRRGTSIWNLSVYNAYNAHNPNFAFIISENKDDESGSTYKLQSIKQITILPILPSFSYTYKF